MAARKKKHPPATPTRKRYRLTLDERQAAVLNEALELLSRVTMGQLEAVIDSLRYRDDKRIDRLANKWEILDIARRLSDIQKAMLFNQPANGSHGIHHPDVPEVARIAWDLHKVVRHELWKNREVLPGEDYRAMCVDAYPADQSAKDQPLAQCERIEEE